MVRLKIGKLILPVWMSILVYLNDAPTRTTQAQISRKTKLSIIAIYQNINLLEELQLITINRENKNNKYTLTPEGIILVQHIRKILEVINGKWRWLGHYDKS